jgi:hypothetical protein
LLLAGVCAVAFVLRLVIQFRRKWFGNDSYYHLLVSRSWRKERRYPKMDPDLLPTNVNTYPPLLQVLVYPFASVSDRIAMTIVSPIVDVATVVLLFVAGELIDFPAPLLPPLVYALSANNLIDASTLNPRPLGNLLLAGTALALVFFADYGELLMYVLLLFLEALVLLSHKLSVQVMLPLVVVMSIVVYSIPHDSGRTWPILASPAFAVLLAALMTGGAYLRKTLPDHIRYVGVHLRRGDYRTGKRRIPSPLNLIKSNPISYIAPFLGMYLYLFGEPIRGYGIWLPWSWTVLVLAQFWVWGDSWRYLQLGTFPGSLITVHFVISYGFANSLEYLLMAMLLAVLAAIAYFQVRMALSRDSAQWIAETLHKMPHEWMKLINGKKVFSNVQHYIVPYITDSSVLLGSPSADGMRASFRISELSKGRLGDIEKYARDEEKEPLDYALFLNKFPGPSSDGYLPYHQSYEVTIYKLSVG